MAQIIEAIKFEDLMNEANTQYSVNRGLHLNSSEWQSYVDLKDLNIFNFIVTGTIATRTYSAHTKKNYYQGFKNTDFKKIELIAFYLFICKINNQIISDFLAKVMHLSNWRIHCNCDSFLYWGWKYKLTKLNSVLGPGESRKPKRNNVNLMNEDNIVCKHLWVTINKLSDNMSLFISKLIPYYKKMYGFSKNYNENDLLKSIGSKGFKKAYTDCKIVLASMDIEVRNLFDKVTRRQSTIILKKLEEMELNNKSVKVDKTSKPKKEYSDEEKAERNRIANEKRQETLQKKKTLDEKFKSMQNDNLEKEAREQIEKV